MAFRLKQMMEEKKINRSKDCWKCRKKDRTKGTRMEGSRAAKRIQKQLEVMDF